MAKTSNCLQLIDRMPQQDQDALLARLDALQAKGLSPKEAQLQAAIDVLAQVEREGAKRSGDVTDTPAFKRWFGDSKVVDEQGKPLVVYHGSTTGGISQATVQNSFFSADPQVASTYALDLDAGRAGDEPVVNAVYLRMENPLVVDAEGAPWMRIPFEGKSTTTDALADVAKRRGHDGVIIRNLEDNVNDEELPPSDIYITLGKRGQIKSATGNDGGFDGQNNDIRKSADRVTDTPEFKAWAKGMSVFDSFRDAQSYRGVFKLYHATPKDFTEFKPGGENPTDSGPAIWLSSSPASTAAAWRVGTEERGFRDGANIMPVYARLSSPLLIDDKETLKWAREVYGTSEFPQLISQKTIDLLKEDGYDSIIALSEPLKWGANADEIIVFEPTQIKSATGNNGQFDPANPDIRKSVDRDANFERWSGGAPVIELQDYHEFRSGEPVVVEALHGTTNEDLTEFKRSRANIESDMGAGFYASNTPEDVAANYANVDGPDLTQRVEQLAERLEQDEEFEGDMDAAREEARKRLSQGSPNTMKLYMRFKNPVVLGDNETYLDYSDSYDEETDEYGEPEGKLVEFAEALRDIAPDFNVSDSEIETAIGKMFEQAEGDGIKVNDALDIIKTELMDAFDDDGSSASREIFRQTLSKIGFDGVIDTTVFDKFGPKMRRNGQTYDRSGGMRGMNEGTVHFIAFEPEQIKSATGNNGEFGENREILKSVDRPQFYSQLQRAIEGVPDRIANMAAPQWKLWLDSNGPKQGVKKDEIEWSGIKDYLDLQGKAKLSKDDLARYLDDSGVKVSETMMGGAGYDETQMLENISQELFNNGYWDISASQQDRVVEVLDQRFSNAGPATKYGKYTLPGGENYRELLITLPEDLGFKTFKAENGTWGIERKDGLKLDGWPTEQAAINSQKSFTLPGQFQSSHWDQKNVLAHIRINDRTAQAPGYVVRNTRSGNPSEVFATREQAEAFQAKLPAAIKTEVVEQPRDVRVLFVEEVQSDWGQAGKKKGFKATPAERAKAESRIAELTTQIQAIRDSGVNYPAEGTATSDVDPKFIELQKLIEERVTLQSANLSEGGLPSPAPFVTKTEGWLNLALKRIAMMAVEGGYDKVAFVNGEQSADRYDLSNQISSISFEPGSTPEGEGLLQAWDLDRKMVLSQMMTTDRIEDYIGKEVAVRLLETGKVRGKHLLDGENIKVGGKGMIKFYDEIVPQALNKLLPKLGGDKLGAVDIGSMDTKQGRESDALLAELGVEVKGKRPPTQSGFDVTDKMRETVKQGVPLFSRDRQASTPEFKKWFGDSKVVDAEGSPLVVYTGTSKDVDFKSFKIPKNGAWFTYDPYTASAYALENDSMDIKTQDYRTFTKVNTASRVMPVYLRIEKMYTPTESEMTAMIRASNYKREQGNLFDRVRREGFDGVDMGNGVYVVIGDATQIKSAIGNDGGFDPSKKDITKSRDRKAPETKEFKAWFGDSKVVNAKGEPLVMLHGTRPGNDITAFDESDYDGIYFTPDSKYAEAFTEDLFDDSGEKGAIYPVYLSIQNPYVVRTTWGSDEAEGFLYRELDRRKLEADGYDGAMLYIDGELDQAQAFRSSQIKSATGNNGDFDGTNPDIRKSSSRTWRGVGYRALNYNPPKSATVADLVRYESEELGNEDIGELAKDSANDLGIDLASIPASDAIWVTRTREEAEQYGAPNEIKAVDVDGWTILADLAEDGALLMKPGIRKSAARKPWFEDLSKLKVSTNYQLGDLLRSSRKLSWWDRTVGTQYNLATKQPEFKRVFDAVQSFINDVSAYATRAADLAPTILPKLDGLKDIIKKPMSAEDVAALRDPVFGGTLKYMRDEDGKIVETDDVQAAGVVFTDDELRSMFDLSDDQIGLYRQFRSSVDQSVTDLALSDMVRYLGEDGRDIAETVMASGNVDVAVGVIESHLDGLAKSTPQRAETLAATIEAINQKGEQANRLMDRGYAPLSRFGQFTTYVVGNDGEQLYFGMFENERDAQKMAREMREQYPDATVSTSTMSQESYKLFSGVTPETLALFGESLGLEESGIDTKSEVFQQYLKVAKTNRSAMKRLIERKGINGFSEDAGRVLAGFVYSNARQISTNLHAGEIGKAAADVKDGDVKDAAIRLMEYIQNPQEEAQAIRGLMFTQFIGGSIASALVNMTQPFTMTAPYLAQFDGVTGATKRMADAMKLVTKGVRNDADLKDALKRAEDLGIVSPQEVHQLMAQARGKGSLITGDGTKVGDAAAKANNFTAKLGLAWGKAFSAAEQFNRRITFIAAYKLARDKGMADPMAFAEKTIAETQGVYNKGNKPAWARGAIGGTLFTFKQYSISYVEFLQRMWGNGPEGKKAVGLALGVLFMSAGLGGMPGADDLDDVIDGFAQRVLGKSFDSKQAKKEFFAAILGQAGAEFVMGGLTGLPGAPIDLSGRLGLGNLIPGTGLLTKKPDYSRDTAEIFGPAGSLFKQVATGAGKLVQGDVAGAAKEVAPVAAQNVIKGVDMAVMGMYRDTKGRKVIDTDPWEAVAKSVGFQPASVKRVQDATGTQQNLIGQNKLRETEIADKWAAGRIERNPAKVEEAKEMLADWNRKNPQSPIRIDSSQINRRVQQAMMDKAKRLEKTAPKEIRQSVKRELERETN